MTTDLCDDISEPADRGPGRREDDRRFQLLTEHSNDVLCELQAGVVTYVSQNVERMSGHPRADFMGRSIAELVHPDDLQLVAPYLARGWTGDIDITVRLADKNGAWQWREARGIRRIDGEGLHRAVLVLRDVNKRHAAEKALRESEARTRALITAIPDFMFHMTREGVYLDFKAERNEDLYVPPETIIGNNMRDLLPPHVSEPAFVAIAEALDSGGVAMFEYSLVKQGQLRDYEARVTACAENEVMVLSRDVTERKHAAETLQASEQRYRSLVDGARDIVYTQDLLGNFTSTNPVASELYGYTPAEFLGMNFKHIVDAQYVPGMLENMERGLRGEPMLAPRESLTHARDGRDVWVEVVAGPIVVDGEVTGFQGIVRDITKRREAEQRVRFQSQLLDAVRQAVVVIDLEGRITFWNRFAEDLFGWTADEIVGRSAIRLGLPENMAIGVEASRKLAAGEHWSGEVSIRDRHGRRFPALVLAAPVYDDTGAFVGGVCVSTDISAVKDAEDETQRADQHAAVMRERARIAQELHDSVAQFFFGIGITSKDLLERKSVSPAMLRRKLVQMRTLSTEGGREIRNAIQTLAPSATTEGIELSIRRLLDGLHEDGIDVGFSCDPLEAPLGTELEHELHHAARELLFNVRKHAQASRVDLRIELDQHVVTMSVADDGIGSAASVAGHTGAGTGLGLQSLRERLASRGGRLEFQDRLEGGVIAICSMPTTEAA